MNFNELKKLFARHTELQYKINIAKQGSTSSRYSPDKIGDWQIKTNWIEAQISGVVNLNK